MQPQRRILTPPRPEPLKTETPSGARAIDETTSELPLGSVLFGKYVVERTVGAGGMGIVIAVRHNQLGELFAMKVLRQKALRAHPNLGLRFLNEAKAAAQLRSDHVVRVYDVGTLESGRPYMMMEHLEGRDLAAVVAEDGRRGSKEVVEYMLQALDAIAEAHTLGIVHRDLKPDNLFLATRPNGGFTLKVLDFGISKQLDVGESDVDTAAESGNRRVSLDSRLTGASGIMGSPYYMSPEQMSCEADVDPRADIWGLGVIMYELLAAAPPFVGSSIAQIYAAVLTGSARPLTEVAPQTNPRLASLVGRCLARDRDLRPQTAVELMAELQAIRAEIDAEDAVMILEESGETPSAKLLSLVETVEVEPSEPEMVVEWTDGVDNDVPEYAVEVREDGHGPAELDLLQPGFVEDDLVATRKPIRSARKTINRWKILIPASLTIAFACVLGRAVVFHAAHTVVSMLPFAAR